jgi:protein-disulfide isomerase
LAALAANDQGKFWEFHVKLFENSPNLSYDVIQKIARELRLDIDRFNKKMKSTEFKSLIKRDSLEGRKIGITGTPTVYVNKKLLFDHSIKGLQEMIEAELKK